MGLDQKVVCVQISKCDVRHGHRIAPKRAQLLALHATGPPSMRNAALWACTKPLYSSGPNIPNVLHPLFLDDLNARRESAEDNKCKLDNLRNRMSKTRVFSPVCGSGHVFVTAAIQSFAQT